MAPKAIGQLAVRKLADKSEGERIPMLVVRDAIHREDGAVIVDPSKAQRILFNPETPELEHEPWPSAGIKIEGEAPKHTRVPTNWVMDALVEGWVELENARPVFKPGGPAEEPWRVKHQFLHADALVIHTVDGDVRYRVTRQPDKYDGGPENGVGEPVAHDATEHHGSPETSVDWFYDLTLED